MAESVGMGAPISSITTGIDRRVPQGGAIVPAPASGDQGSGGRQQASNEPTQLALGTVIEAVVRVPAGSQGPPAGAHILLRIVAPNASTANIVTGTIVDSVGSETLLASAIGLLALQQRLALAPGTTIAFMVVETAATAAAATPATPVRNGSGWATLDETLETLAKIAPVLAHQLRDELTPQSGPALAGTLLFLLGALYHGKWPGPAITNALSEAGYGKLLKRLADDVAALRRLSDDQTTGEWRVLILPLLIRQAPLPIRLYLNRRKAATQDGLRFAIEVELASLGPVQIDVMLRGLRLIVVLRTHRDLTAEQRQELRGVFEQVLKGSGLSGDLNFATVATFLVRPMSPISGHIKITA